MDHSPDEENRLSEIRPASGSFTGRLPSISESVGSSYNRPLLPRPVPESSTKVPKLINPRTASFCLDGIPIRTYQICGKAYNMQQPANEGVASFSRQTIGGKNLSYRLKVVQQPEKARACGSGPRCKYSVSLHEHHNLTQNSFC